jgi:hypothetical protein
VTSIILSTPLELFENPRIALTIVLKSIFPDNNWILTAIHISILSAVLGTIHSMIWSSGALMVSLLKQIHGIKIPQQIAVVIVGCCISLSFFFLKNINLFFSLTAVFIILAYSLSIITLLTIKEEWKSGRNLLTIFGLITAGIIFYFAAEGVIQQLIG